MVKIGFLHTRIRIEEKLLLEELQKRPGVEVVMINDDETYFDISRKPAEVDVLFERSISYYRGLYISRLFSAHGVPVVNTPEVAACSGDKYVTSQILVSAGIPSPRVMMAFSETAALKAADELGYPCVLKPVVGSWGRLLAKADNRATAEAFIEHKATLGGASHQIFYLQEYVEKPGRDIRAFCVGDDPICAIYRTSENWITNTARGGEGEVCPVTPELDEICRAAAQAVGGGVLAIDVLEDPQRGFLVNEVNHTMEFHTLVPTTGIDVAGIIVDYTIGVASKASMAVPVLAPNYQDCY